MDFKKISSIIVKRNIQRGYQLEKILKRELPNWEHGKKLKVKGKNKIIDIVLEDEYVFELKYGFEFDTKKAFSECQHLVNASEELGGAVPIVVLFTAQNEEDVKKFKYKGADVVIMTGREFCEEFTTLNYNSIIAEIESADLIAVNKLIKELEDQCLI